MVEQLDYEARPLRPSHIGAMEPQGAEYMVARLRRISWGAVFAGIAVSLMAHLLLNMLGLGIGLSTIDPASGQSPDADILGMGAGIWWAVSGIIAALIGGWVAGRSSGIPGSGFGTIHGLVTWAATTLAVLFILGSIAGGAMGGLLATASRILPGAAMVAGMPAAGDDTTTQGTSRQTQDALEEARDLIGAAISNPDEVANVMGPALAPDATPQEREAAISMLTQQGGLTRAEAEQRLEQWRGTYQQAAEGAEDAAEVAAEVSSTGAIAAFVALLLGAVAGALGGLWGAPRDILVDDLR